MSGWTCDTKPSALMTQGGGKGGRAYPRAASAATFGIGFLLLLAVGAGAVDSGNGRPPNIVFILVDDLGWADLGCYGNQYHETPNIDGLAEEGMRFTDAYAACPVCSPSRASILTGQYPARLGITDFIPGHWRPYARLRVPTNRTQYLPLELTTIAEALAEAGYVSGAFGKWHLGGRDHFPDKQGFDEMLVQAGGGHFGTKTVPDIGLDKDDYLAEALTDRTIAFMEKHQDRPFFVYLSHYAVHIPLHARQELIAKYRKKKQPAEGVHHPVYAAMVEHVDRSVGRVTKALERLGLAENTLVVVFSDNGGLRRRFDEKGDIVTSNAPLRDEKGSLYEGGIRVPFIARWPGRITPDSESDAPVTSVDFFPTFLRVAGVSAPEEQAVDGADLGPVLRGKDLGRQAIYWHYPHYHHSVPGSAVREGPWKLIEFFEPGHGPELYRIAEDIGEENNLAQEHPDVRDRLLERLAGWREQVAAPMPEANPGYDPEKAGEWGRHPDRPPRKR